MPQAIGPGLLNSSSTDGQVGILAETLELGLLCGYDCARMTASKEWDVGGM